MGFLSSSSRSGRRALLAAALLLCLVKSGQSQLHGHYDSIGSSGPVAAVAAARGSQEKSPHGQVLQREPYLLLSSSALVDGIEWADVKRLFVAGAGGEAATASAASSSNGVDRGGDAAARASSSRSTLPLLPRPPPHKPLLPLDADDAAVFALAALTILLAAGGGIGGGAIYMPLYVTLGGWAPRHAVALSNLTILGGALASFAVNVHRRHPRARDRPLIDWTLILVRGRCSRRGAGRARRRALSLATAPAPVAGPPLITTWR